MMKREPNLFCSIPHYSILFFPVLRPLLFQAVVPLTDLLAQFDELHLCWHVSHGPHTLPQVFVTDVAFFVPVKLHKRLTELCQKTHKKHACSYSAWAVM